MIEGDHVYRTKNPLTGEKLDMPVELKPAYDRAVNQYNELCKRVDPSFLEEGARTLTNDEFTYATKREHIKGLVSFANRINEQFQVGEGASSLADKFLKRREVVVIEPLRDPRLGCGRVARIGHIMDQHLENLKVGLGRNS